ncbi:glutamate-1-semialdehyde 2,1-aminomutase [Candidatus Magnetominusculus xianensis]|uniref:Glutamate-1-semialdehyde 2,1-aminomutase n=1 Tax=Candidatus Magnetominusculus xianensis TaxID=1748249 RepID=A0ABR5SBI8_9BACT|nr:glutamate-1-semialdehyde 2,1-aminomutase [Candidatus Magnetominusculus xianensis]KWT76817.1 glutamate-1-semialdehyde 2,1-aminomutase [Candidatus Magnetominusculus xianensis]MBF0402677.1 glutamate-1-semialdehyde 2,1-aminomutase [Nitrospirota bacterium]
MRKNWRTSKKLFQRAEELFPGGVNSPVRAFKAVGGNPIFIDTAYGAKIFDVDGNGYIDYVMSWGPLILGHAHKDVVDALTEAAEDGVTFGAPTLLEIKMGEIIQKYYPSMERMRLVSSGTEATMSAIRVARAFTKRDKVMKFEGCYHGHADGLLVKAGSGAATHGQPSSLGVPQSYAQETITVPYNDIKAVEAVVQTDWKDIACIIVEPIAANMGLVLPKPGFLEGLREITEKHGIVLIFDEVVTGFRVAVGGAQELYDIKPDLTCLGKIIGGGLPAGAYGGKKEIMSLVSPDGPVYQAGTLSGNPAAMAAGIETIKNIGRKGFYDLLESKAEILEAGFKDAIKRAKADIKFYRIGSMFCQYFTEHDVYDYETAAKSDTKLYAEYFRSMLEEGVYFPPSQFETCFLSISHSKYDIQFSMRKSYKVLRNM